MKILWLHSHFLNWMGGHKYVFEVTKRFSKDHQVTVCTSVASDYAKKQFQTINVPLHTVNFLSTNNPLYWFFLKQMINYEVSKLRVFANSADVIITSYFPAHLWAKKLNKPYIQICFEPLAFFYDQKFLSGYAFPIRLFYRSMKALYNRLDKEALLAAKSVLTLSKFNKDWIKSVYGRKDIGVVYEGVDTDFFKPTKNKTLQKKYSGKRIILHSTDFTPTKGTDLLVNSLPKVVKRFPNLLLLITSTLGNLKKMEFLADKLGVRKNIVFLGNVDYLLLPAYYTLADVVVQPTRGQSMSLTVKEAMACEKPVITGLEGREMIQDGEEGFLVNSINKEALSSAIIKILKNRRLSLQMGKKGRKIIKEKFSWDKVSDSILKSIDDIF